MIVQFLIVLLLITTPAWAWTKNYAIDPVPGATLYRLEKTVDLGVTWTLAMPDSSTPNFSYIGAETGLVLFRISALNGSQITTRTFDGLWHNELWVASPPPDPPPTGIVTVNFNNPLLPGSSGSLIVGLYKGIDFGFNQWRWSGPTGLFTSRNIYFSSSTGTSRMFMFSPGPKTLLRFRVVPQIAGVMTVSDDLNQIKTQTLMTGSIQTVTTGWAQPSTVVTISYPAGWVFNIDNIVYQ